jgi:glycogen synthase
MTVLMTADTVGGVWSHALELAAALHRQGVDVVLAALGPPPTDAQVRQARGVPGLELRPAPFRLPWMVDPWSEVARAGEHLLSLAAATGAELVHLSEPVFASLPWDVPVVAVGHSCVLSWYAAVRREHAPAEWDRYRHAMRSGLAAADAVVAPSRAMLSALQRHYGIMGGFVVSNGREPTRFAAASKAPIVLTAGRLWDPAKNVGALAAVSSELRWPVHAAGETRAPDGETTPVLGSMHLLGALDPDAMATAFAHAAIYALPARYEPFGQSVLEAGLSGCALVLGDIPSLRELWGGAARFVAPDDRSELRAVLSEVIDDPDLRRSLAFDARRRALSYTPDRMARGYLDVYAHARRQARASTAARERIACAS